MNSNRERWLQLALVAVCAALEEVECTDEALTEALFAGMPGIKIDEVTAAAVAEALRRSSNIKEAAALLDRSRGFISVAASICRPLPFDRSSKHAGPFGPRS